MKRSQKRKSAKISEAVFRGKKSLYGFEVFPLTAADIQDGPAVFIISRRRIDKFGRGHHVAVCIGETDSIRAEIKKHKRAKCVKQNAANVVCILGEMNEAKRSNVIDDLTAAREFSCVRNSDESNIRRSPNVNRLVFAPVELPRSKPSRTRPVAAKSADEPEPNSKRTAAKKSQAKRPAKSKPVKTAESARSRHKTAKASRKPVKTVAPKKAKPKSARPGAAPASERASAKGAVPAAAKARPSTTKRKISTPDTKRKVVAAKRTAAAPVKKAGSPKPKPRAPKPAVKKAAATAAAKRKNSISSPAKRKTTASKTGTRVQGGVDSDRRQHRLPKPKRAAKRTTKARAAGKPGPRKKAAA